MSSSTSEKTASGKRTLLLLALVCVIPVVASYLAFYLWRPANTTNYGDLLPVTSLSQVTLKEADGRPFELSQLRGKWVLAMIDSGACNDRCREKLTYMRQLRLTQGKDMDRIERVWLISDAVRPITGFIPQFDGTRELFVAQSDVVAKFPAATTPTDHIYIIDPLGNLFMRFPRDPDTKGMVKDLTRLLRVSRVG